MFAKNSVTSRIAVGELTGLLIGLAGFFLVPIFWPEATLMLRWGILLWYMTLGAIIGMFGVYTRHPIFPIPLPWWVRGPFLGGWMNFVLMLFAYDIMEKFMISYFGPDGLMTSPFWFVLEGAIIGLVIGFLATKIGGEGEDLPIA